MHQTVDSISYIYLEKIILLTKLIECHICLTLGSNVSAKSVGLGITSVYTRVVIYVSDVDLDGSMILAGNQSVGPRAVHCQELVCLLLFSLIETMFWRIFKTSTEETLVASSLYKRETIISQSQNFSYTFHMIKHSYP